MKLCLQMTWLTWLPKIPKASTNKQLELIHELNKIFAYKISTQKWVVVLYTWRRQRQPTPVVLPGKSHGWRSLVGCSPWGSWVGHDWATSLSLFTFMHWRKKWQPTPVFCLENPRDGGAWWAAVYGVAQSQTWLKWLSSSSSSSSFIH